MKNLNIILSRTVLIGLMTLVVSCVDKKKEGENKAENHHDQEMHEGEMHHDNEMIDGSTDTMAEKSDMTVTESNTASPLIENYLVVKNALVNDDSDVAQKAGERLAKSAEAFDVSEVEESKQKEVKSILDKIKTLATQISENDIAQQRTHFAEINVSMKDLLSITGSDRTLYEQYCPMYANNEGGSWLSESQDIKNPLFGSQMLKCGAVKQTIVLQ